MELYENNQVDGGCSSTFSYLIPAAAMHIKLIFFIDLDEEFYTLALELLI